MATRSVCSQCGAPLQHEQDVLVTEPPSSQFDSGDDTGTADDAPTSLDHASDPVTLTDVVSRFNEDDGASTGPGTLLDRASGQGAGTGRGALMPHRAAFLHGASQPNAVSVAGATHGEPALPWAANISNLVPIWRPVRLGASAPESARRSSGMRNLVRGIVVVSIAALAYYLGYRQSTGQQTATPEPAAAATANDARAPGAPQAADTAQSNGRDQAAARSTPPSALAGRPADAAAAVEAPLPTAGAAGRIAGSQADAAAAADVPRVGAATRNRSAPVKRAPLTAAPAVPTRTEAVGGAALAPAPVNVKTCTAAIAALGLCTPDQAARKDAP